MKAAIRRNYCSPEEIKIEEIEKPTLKDNEVLVKVHATTVNRTDCANLTAKPFIMRFVLGFFKPRIVTLGTDFAGEVVSMGSAVKCFKNGDRVFGFIDTGLGSQGSYMKIAMDHLYGIPDNIDYKVAASSLEGAHYAYTNVRIADFQPGQNVLINGATGGIGSAFLQFLRTYDVKITATCNTKNIDLIRSLGADKIFDYITQDFTTDIEKYDYIFDAVGKSTFGKCKPLLKENGIYISSELGPYAQNLFYALIAPLSKKKVIFPIPYGTKESIPYIIDKLKNETFKPVIDKEYPLEKINEAYKYVIKGLKTGNVVVNIHS